MTGVVRDGKTGLEWQQATVSTTYSYPSAVTYCSGNTPGLPGTGWRLPAIKELQTLIDDETKDRPTIDPMFAPTASNYFWSMTLVAGSVNNAWLVYFGGGNTASNVLTSTFNVRCVR
jgi:hypothetical protein